MKLVHQEYVYRRIYRAQLKKGMLDKFTQTANDRLDFLSKRMDQGDLLTLSLFHWQGGLFVYYESPDVQLEAVDLLGACAPMLEEWPGADSTRHWVPMMDIFHYHRAERLNGWQRETVEKRLGRVVRLKPEMVSSYIFYHFQLQEEGDGKPGHFGTIALHEDLLFFYIEEPCFVEPPYREGKLTTSNTPAHWHDVMEPHFKPWDDGTKGPWVPADMILAL